MPGFRLVVGMVWGEVLYFWAIFILYNDAELYVATISMQFNRNNGHMDASAHTSISLYTNGHVAKYCTQLIFLSNSSLHSNIIQLSWKYIGNRPLASWTDKSKDYIINFLFHDTWMIGNIHRYIDRSRNWPSAVATSSCLCITYY